MDYGVDFTRMLGKNGVEGSCIGDVGFVEDGCWAGGRWWTEDVYAVNNAWMRVKEVIDNDDGIVGFEEG